MLVVGVAGFLAVRFTGSSPSPASRQAVHPALGENNLGVVYGATPHQVLDRLASPDRKQAACWIYDAPHGKVNGIATFHGVDGIKYCFRDGVVADIEWHFETFIWHRKTIAAHWDQPEDFGSTISPPNVMAG